MEKCVVLSKDELIQLLSASLSTLLGESVAVTDVKDLGGNDLAFPKTFVFYEDCIEKED